MTARDQKSLKILIVLGVVLGITAVLSFRNSQPSVGAAPPPTATVASPATPPPSTPKQIAAANASDARIRLDLLKSDGNENEVGRNNLFQYRGNFSAQLGSTGGIPGARGGTGPTPPPAPPVFFPPTTPVNPGPPPPPPGPPPMQFKYDGFMRTPDGLVASLSDNTGHYSLREGDILIGRYRVAKVTDTIVEVEDLQVPRRQAFPRVQPQ
jgi:hypothetical protein